MDDGGLKGIQDMISGYFSRGWRLHDSDSGGHMEVDLKEEGEASRLCGLVRSLPFPYGDYLPRL